jgi:hypothetical protein
MNFAGSINETGSTKQVDVIHQKSFFIILLPNDVKE